MVALTFDDGPGIGTAAVLSELERLHAPATFFVLGGAAAARPDVVRAEQAAGMQIANHTWSHRALPTLPAGEQRSELRRTQDVLTSITGARPRFFRPPNWRFGKLTARVAAGEHLIGVMRTVDTHDWTLPGVREIVRRALRVKPGGVVAMHDGGGVTRAQTASALPLVVQGLRRRGLRLVTIAELYRAQRPGR
jgi:peptidoglycan/xylan/chitin deacetylase (PgdA/CDA1 family)